VTARRLLLLGALAAVTVLVGAVGGIITAPAIPTWYAHLAKPSFNPPSGVFAPVWTTLYILMAVAAWRVVLKTGWASKELALYGIQLALNLAWSFLFFGRHDPGAALLDLGALWLVIATTLVAFWARDRLAGLLFVPYLAWVSFAGALNAAVWFLNR